MPSCLPALLRATPSGADTSPGHSAPLGSGFTPQTENTGLLAPAARPPPRLSEAGGLCMDGLTEPGGHTPPPRGWSLVLFTLFSLPTSRPPHPQSSPLSGELYLRGREGPVSVPCWRPPPLPASSCSLCSLPPRSKPTRNRKGPAPLLCRAGFSPQPPGSQTSRPEP